MEEAPLNPTIAAAALGVLALTGSFASAAPPSTVGAGVCVNGIAADPFLSNTWGVDVFFGVIVATNGPPFVSVHDDQASFRRACCASVGEPPSCYLRLDAEEAFTVLA